MISSDLRFTANHCWVRDEGDLWVVGITDYAQEQMGDLTFVELPELDEHVDADDEIAVVESVKSANSIFAPAAGKIVAINEALLEQPELVNQDPFGRGWLFKMKPDDPSGLENLLD
ncbi:MAG TPA: glycine cleavage system protein GcvH, partial [Kiritimatiellia bacterium]|nr:glycine cleavage system protein GcvH [Kiritimatiellia bacterium]